MDKLMCKIPTCHVPLVSAQKYKQHNENMSKILTNIKVDPIFQIVTCMKKIIFIRGIKLTSSSLRAGIR